MDSREWQLAQLRRWLELVERRNRSGTILPALEDEIAAHEGVVHRVLDAQGFSRRALRLYPFGRLVYERAIVLTAVKQLEMKAELDEHLGSTAPRMRADDLHSLVWDAAKSLWADGHHTQAVQRAATFLNAHVQSLVGRTDASDATLMQQVFSSDAPSVERKRLRWPGAATDLGVRSMNEGLRGFGPGAFQAIRNPATHGTDVLPEQEALEQLSILSMLARWIDVCEVVEAP